jgi:hypothetical protein
VSWLACRCLDLRERSRGLGRVQALLVVLELPVSLLACRFLYQWEGLRRLGWVLVLLQAVGAALRPTFARILALTMGVVEVDVVEEMSIVEAKGVVVVPVAPRLSCLQTSFPPRTVSSLSKCSSF